MKQNKLLEIHNSYVNGQKYQMRDQIKAYGVRRFHLDLFDYLFDYLAFSGNDASRMYVNIVTTFHRLNRR